MITPKQIANSLLIDTCRPVCALIALSEGRNVVSLHVFDPDYCKGKITLDEDVYEIWMIANHEDGCMDPKEAEWELFESIMNQATGKVIRFFLSSEYWECREICMAYRHESDRSEYHGDENGGDIV